MEKKYKVKLRKEYKDSTTENMNRKFLSNQEFLNNKFKLTGRKTEYDNLLSVIFGK